MIDLRISVEECKRVHYFGVTVLSIKYQFSIVVDTTARCVSIVSHPWSDGMLQVHLS